MYIVELTEPRPPLFLSKEALGSRPSLLGKKGCRSRIVRGCLQASLDKLLHLIQNTINSKSQDETLKDDEIARIASCSARTVRRIRFSLLVFD